MRNFKFFICVILIFIFTFTLPCYAQDTIYVWSQDTISASSSSSNIEANKLALECGSAILIEQTTGQILYEHNIHEKLRPASVTKVMSILLIMEALDSRKNKSNRQSTMQ